MVAKRHRPPTFDESAQGTLEKPATLTRVATLELRVTCHQIRVHRNTSELVQEIVDEANEYQIVRHVLTSQ